MKLKEHKDGESLPSDFWNYLVNPITGYYVEPLRRNSNKESKKYYRNPYSK